MIGMLDLAYPVKHNAQLNERKQNMSDQYGVFEGACVCWNGHMFPPKKIIVSAVFRRTLYSQECQKSKFKENPKFRFVKY